MYPTTVEQDSTSKTANLPAEVENENKLVRTGCTDRPKVKTQRYILEENVIINVVNIFAKNVIKGQQKSKRWKSVYWDVQSF